MKTIVKANETRKLEQLEQGLKYARGMQSPEQIKRAREIAATQRLIAILDSGREQNHLNWLATQEPQPADLLLAKKKKAKGAKKIIRRLSPDEKLATKMAKYYADPYGFVMAAYPWGVKGTALEHMTGPDENQEKFLNDLGDQVRARAFDGVVPVMPILMTATSGHGTGKSVMGAWIADWNLSTRANSMGTVTAGTWPQLESRTWAQIQYWTKLCVTGHWFNIQAHGVYHKLQPKTWKVTAQTCKEQNAQAFAGQHAATSTSWYMFDEASLVPDAVWTVANGGLTDGEPMWFAWGQPERNTGRFYEVNFGKLEHRWNHRRIDSRTSRFANKELMAEWLNDYGEDSDFYRIRVLGLPPSADELQFIDRALIQAAMKRAPQSLCDEPLICGVDVSGGGSAWNVCAFRRGLDARTLPRIRIPGEHTRDRSVLVGRLSEVLKDERRSHKVAAMFIDIAFGAAIYERLRSLGFNNVFEVDFGLTHTPDRSKSNMRAYMWDRMKDWLLKGAIPDEEKMLLDLSSPGYAINRSNKLVLESKADMRKRGLASPDDGDALALTFARPVVPAEKEDPDEDEEFTGISLPGIRGGWMR